MPNFYIPRSSSFGGNPWQGAANAYGQELDRLGSLQQQGMADQAQQPLTLYQMFTQGFEKAQAKKQAEEEAAAAAQLQQDQLARQNRLADIASKRADDTLAMQQDAHQLTKNMEAEKFLSRMSNEFTGDPKQKAEMVLQAGILGIPMGKVTEMFDAKRIPSAPVTETVTPEPAGGLPAPDGSDTPASWDFQSGETPESYLPGTGYALKQQAAKAAADKETAAQEFKQQGLDLAANAENRKFQEGQAREDNRTKMLAAAVAKVGAGKASLTDPDMQDMIKLEASNYLRTRTMPALGMGSAPLRAEILKEAARQAKVSGVDSISSAAEYKASSQSLANLTKQNDLVIGFEKTAGKNLDMMMSLGQKLQDSGSPLLNQPIRTASLMMGGSDQAAFNAARQVAANEIAKVTALANSGVITDSQRHEYDAILRGDATIAQMLATVKTLRQDMANRLTSNTENIARVKAGIGAGKNGGSNQPKTQVNPANGKTYYLHASDGKYYLAPEG